MHIAVSSEKFQQVSQKHRVHVNFKPSHTIGYKGGKTMDGGMGGWYSGVS